jgi:hypothetical protein
LNFSKINIFITKILSNLQKIQKDGKLEIGTKSIIQPLKAGLKPPEISKKILVSPRAKEEVKPPKSALMPPSVSPRNVQTNPVVVRTTTTVQPEKNNSNPIISPRKTSASSQNVQPQKILEKFNSQQPTIISLRKNSTSSTTQNNGSNQAAGPIISPRKSSISSGNVQQPIISPRKISVNSQNVQNQPIISPRKNSVGSVPRKLSQSEIEESKNSSLLPVAKGRAAGPSGRKAPSNMKKLR